MLAHLANTTKLTRNYRDFQKTGVEDRDMTNRKPYRTKAQKLDAKERAYKGKDGTFHSAAPKSYHPVIV